MKINQKLVCLVFIIILIFSTGCEKETIPSKLPPGSDQPGQPAEPTQPEPPPDTSEPTSILEPVEGVISEIIHLVDAHPHQAGDWEEAQVDMALYPGGEVWAKAESTALIQVGENMFSVGDQNFIRVAPNTIFSFEHPDDKTIQLNLQEGQVWINVDGLSSDETFQVETTTAIASVDGTRFSVSVDEAGQTIVSSQIHTITVATDEGAVSVGPRKETRVQVGELPTEPDKVSDIESIRWSLAAGPQLDVVTPVGELVGTFKALGTGFPGYWSGDGQVFSFETYRPDLPHENWNYMNHFDVSTFTPITMTVIPTETYDLSYSPVSGDVAWVQVGDRGMEICTASSLDGSPTCFTAPESYFFSEKPEWSPNGEKLLYKVYTTSIDGADNLYVSNPDGSESIQVTDLITGTASRFIWSPDGSQIAYSYAYTDDWNIPGQAWIVNSDGTNPKMIMDNLESPRSSSKLSWSPNGEWLALASPEGLNLVSSNTITGTINIHPDEGGDFYNLNWSPTPTGWPLLYSYYNSSGSTAVYGNYYIRNLSDPPMAFFVSPWGPVYSPDAMYVAFGGSTKISDTENLYETTIYIFKVLNWWR